MQQLSCQGLAINEGVTVDARLVQSANHSLSNKAIKNNKPHYGLKEHAAVDTNHGFVLATKLTPSSVSVSVYLPYCVAASCHTAEPIEKVYADTRDIAANPTTALCT